MTSIGQIATFDLVIGSIAALGLIYLLYSGTFVVHYPRFFRLILIGLLVYALTGPVIGTFAPRFIHGVHAIAVLCITIGLFDLANEPTHSNLDLAEFLLQDSRPSEYDASGDDP